MSRVRFDSTLLWTAMHGNVWIGRESSRIKGVCSVHIECSSRTMKLCLKHSMFGLEILSHSRSTLLSPEAVFDSGLLSLGIEHRDELVADGVL